MSHIIWAIAIMATPLIGFPLGNWYFRHLENKTAEENQLRRQSAIERGRSWYMHLDWCGTEMMRNVHA